MDVSQDSWILGKIHQDNWSEAVVRIEFKNVQTAGRKQEHRPKTEKSFLQTLTQLLCHFWVTGQRRILSIWIWQPTNRLIDWQTKWKRKDENTAGESTENEYEGMKMWVEAKTRGLSSPAQWDASFFGTSQLHNMHGNIHQSLYKYYCTKPSEILIKDKTKLAMQILHVSW